MNPFTLILLLLALTGCYCLDLSTEQSTAAKPALLTNHNQDNLEQIRLIVAEALGTQNIGLSQSIFKRSSLLVIDRKPIKSVDESLLFSETDLPDHFILLKDSQGCVIEHKQSQRRWYLQTTDCIEEAQ